MIRWKATSKFYRDEMMDHLVLKDNLTNPNFLLREKKETELFENFGIVGVGNESLYENLMKMLDSGDENITEFYIENRVAKL
jgi:hypothetical protein